MSISVIVLTYIRRRSSKGNICVSTGAKVKDQNDWNWIIKLKKSLTYIMIDILLHNLHSNMRKNQMKLQIMKKTYCQLLKISFVVTDRGLVEILRLHRKWKNKKMKKTKNIVLFQNRLRRELFFWNAKFPCLWES